MSASGAVRVRSGSPGGERGPVSAGAAHGNFAAGCGLSRLHGRHVRRADQPEIFDKYVERLPTGEHIWWDQTSPDWIAGVSSTGRAFYNRLIPAGLDKVPGLVDTLTVGAWVLETACGAAVGLVQLATRYPASSFVGIDGDAYSLELAADKIRATGLSDRIDLVHTPMENFAYDAAFDAVVNNIPCTNAATLTPSSPTPTGH
jgi:tRNA G46 methylase TrmB